MDCRELMECVFDINDNDIKLYKFLIGKQMKVEDIAKIFKKDRSTIQRSLKKLSDCMLVEREKKIIDKGGYYYIYTAVPPNEAKNLIKICLNNWYEKMIDAVENFEKDFR